MVRSVFPPVPVMLSSCARRPLRCVSSIRWIIISIRPVAANSAGAIAWCARMIRAAAVDAGLDLRPLLGAMARSGIRFRVNEESGSQVIWVSSELEVARTAQLLEEWQKLQAQGAFVQQRAASGRGLAGYFPVGNYVGDLLRATLTAPVTIVLIVAALIVAAVSQLGADLRPVDFMFYPALNRSEEH